jgi:SH3 domain protein
MLNKSISGFILVLLSLTALAQENDTDRKWVTDKLRLSLYQQANAQSQVLKYLTSGDMLEIEQISGAYALVTTPDGSKGWVKRGFLVDEPTSGLLLDEQQEKIAGLEDEIERLGSSKVVIDQYEKDMDAMVARIEALEQENEIATATVAELRDEIETRDRALQEQTNSVNPLPTVLIETAIAHWQIVAAAAAVLALLVALITKSMVESRIRKRFHGIKIW